MNKSLYLTCLTLYGLKARLVRSNLAPSKVEIVGVCNSVLLIPSHKNSAPVSDTTNQTEVARNDDTNARSLVIGYLLFHRNDVEASVSTRWYNLWKQLSGQRSLTSKALWICSQDSSSRCSLSLAGILADLRTRPSVRADAGKRTRPTGNRVLPGGGCVVWSSRRTKF